MPKTKRKSGTGRSKKAEAIKDVHLVFLHGAEQSKNGHRGQREQREVEIKSIKNNRPFLQQTF